MVVLRAIAKYNEDGFDIQHQDVAMAQADPDGERDALMHASPAMSPPVSPVAPTSLRAQQAGHRHRSKGKWYHEFAGQMSKLFSPKWRRTVTLMWIIWGAMALAYTMFNVWLPAVLESRQTGPDAIRSGLWDLVLYALAGCPGSVIGAWMIQTKLGRRRSLAICTIATAVSVFAFVGVRAGMALTVSSMFISLTGTAMYAVLYGMTPETFGTEIRGTACGTSAALSRLTGVIAPVTAGILLTMSQTLPLLSVAVIYVFTAFCSLLLPPDRKSDGGPVTMPH
ncbi:membrane transporter [Trichosporon asahii var. asahii CBS 8904]|uniref:Membrane transporter n=1 Tax=Trichosporon asahii var. asahii (strain CBS 8904) TaxID=1220162 RepID=K1VGB8_TRIAC|nr:membrane transporter [Trichosporon asahii var. asahii CBS 8904]